MLPFSLTGFTQKQIILFFGRLVSVKETLLGCQPEPCGPRSMKWYKPRDKSTGQCLMQNLRYFNENT
jgi:hypothetical protein